MVRETQSCARRRHRGADLCVVSPAAALGGRRHRQQLRRGRRHQDGGAGRSVGAVVRSMSSGDSRPSKRSAGAWPAASTRSRSTSTKPPRWQAASGVQGIPDLGGVARRPRGGPPGRRPARGAGRTVGRRPHRQPRRHPPEGSSAMTAPPGGARVPVPWSATASPSPASPAKRGPYLNLDAAASTAALPAVAARRQRLPAVVLERPPRRRLQVPASTVAYEQARAAALAFAGRAPTATTWPSSAATPPRPSTIWPTGCASAPTTSSSPPWSSTTPTCCPGPGCAGRRFVECGPGRHLRPRRRRRRSRRRARARGCWPSPAASNVTGWLPPIDEHHRRRPRTGACPSSSTPPSWPPTGRCPRRPTSWPGAATRCTPRSGRASWSARRATFAEGDPFLAGGGAVDLVDLDEVIWTDPPEREEAGSPNVIGAVALHAAIDGSPPSAGPPSPPTTTTSPAGCDPGWPRIDGVRLLGPPQPADTLPVATFVVDGVPHALVAARLSAEYAIGVRHGCFCAHPYLMRLLGLSHDEVAAYRQAVRAGDRSQIPGAVRASCGINTQPGRYRPAPRRRRRDRPRPTAPVPYARTRPPGTTGPTPTRPDGPPAIRAQVPPARGMTPAAATAASASSEKERHR